MTPQNRTPRKPRKPRISGRVGGRVAVAGLLALVPLGITAQNDWTFRDTPAKRHAQQVCAEEGSTSYRCDMALGEYADSNGNPTWEGTQHLVRSPIGSMVHGLTGPGTPRLTWDGNFLWWELVGGTGLAAAYVIRRPRRIAGPRRAHPAPRVVRPTDLPTELPRPVATCESVSLPVPDESSEEAA